MGQDGKEEKNFKFFWVGKVAHGTAPFSCLPYLPPVLNFPENLTVSVASMMTAICACLSAVSAFVVSRSLFLRQLTGDVLRALPERLDDGWHKPSTPTLEGPPLPPRVLAVPVRGNIIVSTLTWLSSSSALDSTRRGGGRGGQNVVSYLPTRYGARCWDQVL